MIIRPNSEVYQMRAHAMLEAAQMADRERLHIRRAIIAWQIVITIACAGAIAWCT